MQPMHDAPMTTEPMTTEPVPAAPEPAPTARTIAPTMAAAAGAVSAALALGLSELMAGLLPGATSLVAAVGQVVIDLQPPGAKDLVVALFGTNDKLALETVVVIVAIARRRGPRGDRDAGRSPSRPPGSRRSASSASLAALGDPLANPAMVAVQAAVAVTIGIQSLSWLIARPATTRATGEAGRDATSDPARRSFLLRTGAVGVGAIAAGLGRPAACLRAHARHPPGSP